MNRFRTAGLLCVVLLQAGWAQNLIRLKNRVISPIQPAGHTRRATNAAVRHFLVQFAAYPDADVLAELGHRRIQVLAYVPDNTLMVSTRNLNLAGLNVTWWGTLDASDKISASPAMAGAPAYLVVFHGDADADESREFLAQSGYTVVTNPFVLPNQFLVTGAFSGLMTVAANDEVAYILPASNDLVSESAVIGCAGAVTAAGPVAEYAQPVMPWGKDASGGVALHYFFDSLTNKLDSTVAQNEITRAFAEWQRYANVTLSAGSATAAVRSIDVLFAHGYHGDAYPFSGSSATLAHTFYPAPLNQEPIAGDMHFNADEAWSVGTSVDLFTVALHETGHALGLGHSDQPGDVMYPYYHQVTGLAPGDITAIQSVYGASGGGSSSGGTGGSGSGGGNSGGGTGTSGGGSGNGSGTGSGAGGGTGTTGGSDTVAPTLTILSPASTIVSTSGASITISGTASDNVGVASVQWSTGFGQSGAASGTVTWSAQVPLLVGTNAVTIRAYDAAGNSGWRAVTVVRY